ncbi:MAG: 5'-nucleotidase C-terminal domain-containing protein [Oscillospiraceae bacterium]|nr:5'-nucleotidase C-terminal domain-containing protein [Oscillospiraceae bacterium]
MKRVLVLALSLAILLSVLPMAQAAEDYSGKTVILYSGNLRGDVDVYAKIAALKSDYQAKGAQVLLADAGNFLRGTAAANTDRGRGVYDLMDAVKYDVAVLGLAEFSYGEATTGNLYHGNYYHHYTQAQLQDGAQEFTYNQNTSGTVTATRPPREPARFYAVSSSVKGEEEYYSFSTKQTLQTKTGQVVTFIGITDPRVAGSVQDVFVDGYQFADGDAVAAAAVSEAEGVTVCLSNAPLRGQYGDIYIEAATGGEAIVGAYVIDNESGAIAEEAVDLSSLTPNAEISAQADALKAAADEVIGTASVTLIGADSANRNRETNLGNLVTDALKWYGQTYIDGIEDGAEMIAIQNGGNCDDFIYPGEITATDLLRALPFSPMGVGVLYVTGQQLLETLEAASQRADSAGFAQVSGMKYVVNTGETYDAGEVYGMYFKADSVNRVQILSVNGKAFDKDARYAVVADNYLFNGNDTYYAFAEMKAAGGYINNGNGVKTRDIVAMYIGQVLGGNIGQRYARTEGRIAVHPFADIAAGKWYFDGVVFAYQNKLFNGTTANLFSPDLTMNRAMMVTVLYRLDGASAAYENTFSDVPSGRYYSEAVTWAAANDIVNGVGGGKFDPEGEITRQQMAAIFYRYAQYKGYDTEKSGSLSAFADDSQVSAYAVSAMQWATAEGLILGVSEGNQQYLLPSDSATRAQLATVFMRFAQSIAN